MRADRRSILVAVPNLEMCGVARSLVGLLGAVDLDRYDVALFIHAHRGALMADIPDGVEVLPELPAYRALERPLLADFRGGRLAMAWAKARAGRPAWTRGGGAPDDYSYESRLHHRASAILPPVAPGRRFDLAISFLAPHDLVHARVSARRKAAWVHTDYSRIRIDAAVELRALRAFDRIVAVSDAVASRFAGVFPALAERLVVMENILDPAAIRRQAAAQDVSGEMPRGPGVRLCSVGELAHAKGFDDAVLICRELTRLGLPVKWYVVGAGAEEARLRRIIRRTGTGDAFVLLGPRANPYPYIAACDAYVQPSRYEGRSLAVREAQILHRPVILTDFPTARSHVGTPADAHVVPSGHAAAARAMYDLLRRPRRLAGLAAGTFRTDYSNRAEIARLDRLFEAG